MCADRENCFVVAGLWREPGQIFRITDPLSHLPKHIEKVKWNTNPRAFLFLHFLLLMWNVNTDPRSVTVDTTKIFLMQVLGTAFASTEMMWGHMAASHLMCQTFPAILPLFHRGQNSDTNHNNRFRGRCLGGFPTPSCRSTAVPVPLHHQEFITVVPWQSGAIPGSWHRVSHSSSVSRDQSRYWGCCWCRALGIRCFLFLKCLLLHKGVGFVTYIAASS